MCQHSLNTYRVRTVEVKTMQDYTQMDTPTASVVGIEHTQMYRTNLGILPYNRPLKESYHFHMTQR